jgi:dTDP-glucose 4,6-dehydratase
VTVLDNLSTGSYDNFGPETRRNGSFTLYEHDVTESLPVRPRFDVIMQLASIPTPRAYMDAPIQTLRTSATGTRRLLNLARRSNAIFLLASTSEVYGNPMVHPQPESYNGNVDPFGPRACYDEGKRYAEALTRAYHTEHDVSVRIARIFNTYGPRMRDDRVIPSFIRQVLRGDPLTIHGDGRQTRSFCYIDDLIRGLRSLINSDVTAPVNIGNPDEVSIRELADVVRNVADRNVSVTHTERPPDDPERRCPNITRAQDRLNWQPSVELRDGIKKTIEEFRKR